MSKTAESHHILKIRNKELDLSTPKVMGILNVTPDSFSDGGEYNQKEAALHRVEEMIQEGAEIIDIGGESTRPGSDPVSVDEEASRVLPVLGIAIERFPNTFFSVDTTKYDVARPALEMGAHIINDVSGLQKEPRFAELSSEFNAGYVLMHSQGDPKTMQNSPEYRDVISDIIDFLGRQIEILESKGVESVIVDPGIGFGKTLQHNLKIISGLHKFTKFGYPVLMGASRKSMIGKILEDRPADGRLAGTLAIHYHSLLQGAKILRVHDVQEATDSIQVFNAIVSAEGR
ncbi:dihydropteroate synthase [Rhodohalobacter sp.]|uniref:dihydropteroate synthase n=1 Tax=Rhodohalobacter sp. TaxID=1974210 RepID=UPI002ACE617E|nr:dihydropteroate synthase [Rhodohalobacter sp.]MDZ7758473.1 dihydropteroate synthase [Rhodohalobacter sp.]